MGFLAARPVHPGRAPVIAAGNSRVRCRPAQQEHQYCEFFQVSKFHLRQNPRWKLIIMITARLKNSVLIYSGSNQHSDCCDTIPELSIFCCGRTSTTPADTISSAPLGSRKPKGSSSRAYYTPLAASLMREKAQRLMLSRSSLSGAAWEESLIMVTSVTGLM